jgi:glycosidase
MCNSKTSYSKTSPNSFECSKSLWDESWSGNPGSGKSRGELQFSDDFFGPFKSQAMFSRCGTGGDDYASVFGDFVSTMFDFDTRNYDFQEIFTEIHKYWIGYADVDGFRMDAAKHVTEDFIAHFATHIRDYALSLGKDNFFIVGEVAGDIQWQARRLGAMSSNLADPQDNSRVPKSLTFKIKQLKKTFESHPHQKYPGLTSIYDFYLGGNFRGIIQNFKDNDHASSPKRIDEYFSGNFKAIAFQQTDIKQAWIPIEIHDWPRLLKTVPMQEATSAMAFAIAFLTTMHGQPVIYYGAEQGLTGSCAYDKIEVGTNEAFSHMVQLCDDNGFSNHGLARQSMFASSGWKLRSFNPKLDALAGIKKHGEYVKYDWKSDPYLDLNSFVYTNTRKMIAIRKSCSALRRGNVFMRYADDFGLLAFSRVGPYYEAVIIMNAKKNAGYNVKSYLITVDKDMNPDGSKFINILTGAVAYAKTGDGGARFLDFGSSGYYFDGRGYAIFVAEKAYGEFNAEYNTHLCSQ